MLKIIKYINIPIYNELGFPSNNKFYQFKENSNIHKKLLKLYNGKLPKYIVIEK